MIITELGQQREAGTHHKQAQGREQDHFILTRLKPPPSGISCPSYAISHLLSTRWARPPGWLSLQGGGGVERNEPWAVLLGSRTSPQSPGQTRPPCWFLPQCPCRGGRWGDYGLAASLALGPLVLPLRVLPIILGISVTTPLPPLAIIDPCICPLHTRGYHVLSTYCMPGSKHFTQIVDQMLTVTGAGIIIGFIL